MNVLITVKTATGDSKVTYTINSENNITAFALAKEAKSAPDVERFATAKELAKLAEQWPAARLVDIWNALRALSRPSDSRAGKRLWSECGRPFRTWRRMLAHSRPVWHRREPKRANRSARRRRRPQPARAVRNPRFWRCCAVKVERRFWN